jgi:molybdopterin converting factor small subunit
MKVDRLRIRVFGMLRNFSDEDGFLNVELKNPVELETSNDLKKLLIRHFETTQSTLDPEVLQECAIADEDSVLSPASPLRSVQGLALLPPVCGG